MWRNGKHYWALKWRKGGHIWGTMGAVIVFNNMTTMINSHSCSEVDGLRRFHFGLCLHKLFSMQDALPAVGSPSIESPATESIANKGVKDEGVEIKGWGGVTPVIEGVKVRQRQARLSLPNIFSSPPRIAAEKDGLIKACKSKKKNVQKILYIIERQPELILVKDADGKLPVHHAASRMPVEVIDALVFPHRDTIFEKDEAGKTAFDYASAYYAAEPVVIALNDKRRKLRDEKARQEREAQAQLERDKLAKGEAEVEDFKREAAEEIDDILKR